MSTRFLWLGWRQVWVCFVALSTSGMIASTYSLIAVPLMAEYQTSRAVLMLAMTVLSGTCAVLSPFLGSLMDRFSLRWLLLLGSLSIGIGYASLSLTTAFYQVLIIFGVFIAPANVLLGPMLASVLLSRWFEQQRGRAIGFAIAGISVGVFCFPIIIQALLEAYSWRPAVQYLGLILTLWSVTTAVLVIDRPQLKGLWPDGAVSQSERAAENNTNGKNIRWFTLLSMPAFWAIVGTVAVVTAGMKGTLTNLAPMVMDAGVSAAQAAQLISIYAACSFMAKLSFAALADRIGPHRLMAFSILGFAVALMLLIQAKMGFGVIVSGVALMGLAGGLMLPMEAYLAPKVFGAQVAGRAMGVLTGVILVVMLCTPPLFGFIFDITGSYQGIFWFFIVAAILALTLIPAIKLPANP